MTDTDEPQTMTDRPTLSDAQTRFERGDFLGARLAAERVLASADTPDQANARADARALLARLAPDPWALRFGLLVLAVLGLLTGLYVR
jgi:hypothetical protein